MSDAALREICEVGENDESGWLPWMADLRAVAGLAGRCDGVRLALLEHAMTLLTFVLGQLPHFRAAYLPCGAYGLPDRGCRWVNRSDLEHVAMQIVGLVWCASSPDDSAVAVLRAIDHAVRVGFLKQRQPEGCRPVVSASLYGMVKVRVYVPEGASEASTRADQLEAGTVASAEVAAPECGVYAWARQAELVRATNQVLGQGLLHKGVLSRACADRHIETNGKSGSGLRVRIASFLAWLVRKYSVSTDEQNQVRNAVIGEITVSCADRDRGN